MTKFVMVDTGERRKRKERKREETGERRREGGKEG